jgi:hypothetical protein
MVFFLGCATTTPPLQLPNVRNSPLKTYKHLDISALNSFYKKTGVTVEKGEGCLRAIINELMGRERSCC